MKLHYGDLTDSTCLVKIINEVKPTEIYNLGAQSHVKVSPSHCCELSACVLVVASHVYFFSTQNNRQSLTCSVVSFS